MSPLVSFPLVEKSLLFFSNKIKVPELPWRSVSGLDVTDNFLKLGEELGLENKNLRTSG